MFYLMYRFSIRQLVYKHRFSDIVIFYYYANNKIIILH